MDVKKTSLSKFFAAYAFKLFLIPVSIVIVVLIAFLLSANGGFLHLANYEENLVTKAAPAIEQADFVTPDLIPDMVEYVLLSNDGTKIVDSGNMSESHISQMWDYLNNNAWPSGLDNPAFKVIESKNSICIIRYSIIVKFSNPHLQSMFPYPFLATLILCIAVFIISIIILNRRVARRMKRELNKLLKTTEKIEQQDLDFTSEVNNFSELQGVTDSLERMRDALKLSIATQIKLERGKTEQISALAHDVKIPVTIIRGNVELLSFTELTDKQKELADDIHSAAMQIEDYTCTLVEVSKLGSPMAFNKSKTTIRSILEDVETEFNAYIRNMHIEFILNNKTSSDTFIFIDSSLVHRSMMNILCNGVEHSSNMKKIILSVELNGNSEIIFEVQDDGDGFSQDALKRGEELFYTQNKSRSNNGHYGIGLSFAHLVARMHGGSLTIQNSNIGGRVRFIIPSNN